MKERKKRTPETRMRISTSLKGKSKYQTQEAKIKGFETHSKARIEYWKKRHAWFDSLRSTTPVCTLVST